MCIMVTVYAYVFVNIDSEVPLSHMCKVHVNTLTTHM